MAEVSITELRGNLADHIYAAVARSEIIYITSRGRRIAALVPVHVAEAVEMR